MRKHSVLFFSVLLVLFFFAGFYLYYIPSNKGSTNHYAFLTLDDIQSDLISLINGDTLVIGNNMRTREMQLPPSVQQKKTLNKALSFLGISVDEAPPKKGKGGRQPKDKSSRPANPGESSFYDITDQRLQFVYNTAKDTVYLSCPISDALNKTIQPHKADFFEYFLFLKITGGKIHVIFKSEDLPLGTDVSTDTLLAGSKNGFYPGITDVNISGNPYKMFYIPVDIEGKPFVLCGFKNSNVYVSGLHQVSPGFIYPLITLLVLLLIISPIFKLYVMGRGQTVTGWDLIRNAFALLVGTMAVTMILLQLLLLKAGDIRQHKDLDSLSVKLDGRFREEIVQAWRELGEIDTIPKHSSVAARYNPKNKPNTNISDSLKLFLKTRVPSKKVYYGIEQVFWADSSGQQIAKGTLLNEDGVILNNIKERNYFKAFSNNSYLPVPGVDTAIFSMEAVQEMSNGKNRIVIARPSPSNWAFIVGMTANMYSVNNTILPAGFGFAIINREGEVQVHSDSSHNLNENFFDEIEDSRQLKSAIAGRQQAYINSIKFYGREYGLLLSPVTGLPFYMLTFQDRGYQLSVNMRILNFALLLCIGTITICLFAWLFAFWKRFYNRPLLFSPMDYLSWVMPGEKYRPIYIAGSIFLSIYILVILLSVFLHDFNDRENNHFILMLLLATPMNITCSLLVLASLCRPRSAARHHGSRSIRINGRDKGFISLIVLAAITLLAIAVYGAILPLSMFIFQVLLVVIMGIIYWYPNLLVFCMGKNQDHHLNWYICLVITLLICLSILPPCLFTWYAHNQEILQAAKRDQLFLAYSIESREKTILARVNALKPLGNPDAISDTLRYHRGIYYHSQEKDPSSRDSILAKDSPDHQADTASSSDSYYFSVANRFSSDYYFAQRVPALQKNAFDISWWWKNPVADTLSFYYTLTPDSRQHGASLNKPKQYWLQINSPLPRRFVILSSWENLTLLVFIVLVLFAGLCVWIRRFVEDTFLQKFVRWHSNKTESDQLPYLKEYFHQDKNNEKKETDLDKSLPEIWSDLRPESDPELLTTIEKKVVLAAKKYEGYFSFLIHKCTPMERLLLANIAKDGFVNYKNSAEIYRLLDNGILRTDDQEIRLFSRGFRVYILSQDLTQKKENGMVPANITEGNWSQYRTIFMVVLIAVAAFIFLTRQESWQRISALLTALGTSLPLLLGLFTKNGKSQAPGSKD